MSVGCPVDAVGVRAKEDVVLALGDHARPAGRGVDTIDPKPAGVLHENELSVARERTTGSATGSANASCAPAAERRIRGNACRGHDQKQQAVTRAASARVPTSLVDHRLQKAAGVRSRRRHDEAIMNSTMLQVKVTRDEPVELHEQVAAEIRRAIAEGEAKPGERLPPAKDFAAVLHVNRNTVLRAFRQLRDEGLLEFQRGRGVTVAGTPSQGALAARALELVQFARRHGYNVDELVAIIKSVS